MSNRAYLVSDNNSSPAFEDENGDLGYESQNILSEGGSYILPIFWLTAFRANDCFVQTIGSDKLTCLLVAREDALRNIEASKDLVCTEFSNLIFHFPRWEEIVSNSKGSHLKIDAIELWQMAPDIYEDYLPQALRWFSSRDESDRDAMLELCGFKMNAATKSVLLNASLATGNHLYGRVS